MTSSASCNLSLLKNSKGLIRERRKETEAGRKAQGRIENSRERTKQVGEQQDGKRKGQVEGERREEAAGREGSSHSEPSGSQPGGVFLGPTWDHPLFWLHLCTTCQSYQWSPSLGRAPMVNKLLRSVASIPDKALIALPPVEDEMPDPPDSLGENSDPGRAAPAGHDASKEPAALPVSPGHNSAQPVAGRPTIHHATYVITTGQAGDLPAVLCHAPSSVLDSRICQGTRQTCSFTL